MIFNEHQSRLWSSMLNCIEDFRAGKVKYYELMGSLEGALDAGDFQDKLLIEQWYEYWTPLEILRANEGNNINVENVNEYLRKMELFLKQELFNKANSS